MDVVVQKIIYILQRVVESVHESFFGVSVTVDRQQDKFPFTLFTRILCVCDSCILLLSSGMPTLVPVLLRNMLEARIDLINLIADGDYFNVLVYAYAHEECKLLSNSEQYDDLKQYFVEGSSAKNRFEMSSKFVEENKMLKDKARIRSRFNEAGRIREYHTIYNFFCRDSHNNIDQVAFGHIGEDEKEAIVHKNITEKDLIIYSDFIIKTCFNSAQDIISHFNLSGVALDKTNSIVQEFDTELEHIIQDQ